MLRALYRNAANFAESAILHAAAIYFFDIKIKGKLLTSVNTIQQVDITSQCRLPNKNLAPLQPRAE